MRFNSFWTYRNIVFSKPFARAVWHARQNIMADEKGLAPPFGPYMAEFDITYRCNCRCQMCQRWVDPKDNELSLSEYQRLADVFQVMGVHQISIAGGEPLMRTDVFDIIGCFSQYGMSVNLCTNGILLEGGIEALCASGATCVTVSLDGAAAATHDAIRGHAGAFDRIRSGILALMRHPAGQRPVVRVRMTVNADNQHEIARFYRQWQPLVDDVLLQPVHLCRDAYYDVTRSDSLNLDPVVLTREIRATPWARDGYLPGLIRSLTQTGTYPRQSCYAGVLMARIDPWGSVYPCLEQHVRIGSVREQDFKSLWESEAFNRERRNLSTGHPCVCWYNNTAVIGHYGTLLKQTRLKDVMRRIQPKRFGGGMR
jgi:MoaA/NifB/PqqE/SkfB family radical SAM enzyme